MRKQLPPIAKTLIHDSSNHRKVIEYLLEGSPYRQKVRGRLRNQDRKVFLAKMEAEYPIAVAALMSKSKVNRLVALWDRPLRKAAKRYFKRARVVVHGTGKHRPNIQRRQKRLTYREYIHSPLWEGRKNLYYQKHGKRCAICRSPERVQLHHMVYTAFNGTEPDQNLIAFCDMHHADFHAKHGSSGNMMEDTLVYVEETKAGVPDLRRLS